MPITAKVTEIVSKPLNVNDNGTSSGSPRFTVEPQGRTGRAFAETEESAMNFKTAAILAALGSALAVSSAHAAVTVGFDIGNVAIGYTDGYYDNDHHWHRWAHRNDLSHFRAAHADMYHGWRHDDKHHH
jgi:hypothetical protein